MSSWRWTVVHLELGRHWTGGAQQVFKFYCWRKGCSGKPCRHGWFAQRKRRLPDGRSAAGCLF